MADDMNKRGQPDRTRININEDHEIRYWTEALGVSKVELEKAVKQVGLSAAAVREKPGR